MFLALFENSEVCQSLCEHVLYCESNGFQSRKTNTIVIRNTITHLNTHRQEAGGAMDDLERVKNKLGSIQQNIQTYTNKVRDLEDERDRLQEEVVKMINVIKEKNEEIRFRAFSLDKSS